MAGSWHRRVRSLGYSYRAGQSGGTVLMTRSGHALDFSPSRDRRRAALSHRHSFPSSVTRDRTQLRRGAVGQIEPDLVDVAPAPAFRRVIAFDDRMPGHMKMLGGMTVRRVVATADVPAGPARPQVHPYRARLQAFLAPARARRHFPDGVFVQTCVGHHALPSCRTSAGRLPASARKACSVATTCAPSPTAAATRLIDPDRTSPMANTPRTLVSSGRLAPSAAAPVSTKPLGSSATPD